IEEVPRLVVDARLVAGLRAALSWRRAADGVETLDRGDLAEDAVARDRLRLEQEPGARARVGTRIPRLDLTDDLAAVGRLPGGPCVVLADRLAAGGDQVRLGGLERPFVLRRIVGLRLALIDLHAGRVRLERERLVRRDLQRLGNLDRGRGGRAPGASGRRRAPEEQQER